jgi:hypothetical protein
MWCNIWKVLPAVMLCLACGSEGSSVGDIVSGISDAVIDAATQGSESNDPCCSPGDVDEVMEGQCLDDYVYSRVCEEEPQCCETQWFPQCAAGYARFSTSCEGGSSMGDDPSGRERSGPFSPDATTQAEHPPFEIDLSVDVGDGVEVPAEGTLFIVGFRDIEAKSGRPERGAMPLHFAPLATQFSDFPHTGRFTLFQGFHYWVMFSTHDNPSPGDHMSQLIEAQPTSAEEGVHFVLGGETIPQDAGSQDPSRAGGG